jgi:transcriptional regulator with XRE-family HTH domain
MLMAFASEIAKEFGKNVLAARRRADISQEELSFRAGLHRTEIGQLERGNRDPKVSTLIKLSGALSLPPGDLLKGMAWTAGAMRTGRFVVRSDADRG